MTTPRTTVYAVETLDGAELDCWVVDSVWSTRDAAETYAREKFQQSGWGSPVPRWEIQTYTLDQGN